MSDRKYMYGKAYYWDGQSFRYAHNDVKVPGANAYVDDNTGELHMDARELLADRMLDINGLAKYLDILPTSVPAMMTRGQLPEPQIRIGKSPLWARPIIEHWKTTRPGRGANLRGRGKKDDDSSTDPDSDSVLLHDDPDNGGDGD